MKHINVNVRDETEQEAEFGLTGLDLTWAGWQSKACTGVEVRTNQTSEVVLVWYCVRAGTVRNVLASPTHLKSQKERC